MKTILKLEELAMLLVCIALLYISSVDWWWYLLLFIGPDISMLGYLAGNKTGAILYNIFHHKAIAILVIAVSLAYKLADPFFDADPFVQAGIVLFGHASMDRIFGYGLKYENGFKFTHLGEIGKK
ncbi:MAG: DUF4260 domain-containing protein [Lacibacter sp.]